MNSQTPGTNHRRDFLKVSAAAASVSAALPAFSRTARGYHHGSDETLKIGLIGCGGRGRDAAINAAMADGNVKITALCDVFPDRVESALASLSQVPELQGKLAVDKEHCFSGLDGYQKLLDSGVDVVLLCSTPYFRPDHMEAAVRANKHIFCEKPISTDVAGALRVQQACELAKTKKLNVVSGLCWRYDYRVVETMKRIHEGAIGEIRAIQDDYLTGTLWHRGDNAMWSPLEYQLRNWLYFTWLSGDLIAEQHIHSLDKAVWLMHDQPPAVCYGTGGRQVRTDPRKWGDVYDHFACCFEWENGVKAFTFARQMDGCYNNTNDYAIGTKGRGQFLDFGRPALEMSDGSTWSPPRDDKQPGMYDAEHIALFRAIRAGTPINNGGYMVTSTLMAILGREACYTGQRITWKNLLASNLKLGTDPLDWNNPPPVEVKHPGRAQ